MNDDAATNGSSGCSISSESSSNVDRTISVNAMVIFDYMYDMFPCRFILLNSILAFDAVIGVYFSSLSLHFSICLSVWPSCCSCACVGLGLYICLAVFIVHVTACYLFFGISSDSRTVYVCCPVGLSPRTCACSVAASGSFLFCSQWGCLLDSLPICTKSAFLCVCSLSCMHLRAS